MLRQGEARQPHLYAEPGVEGLVGPGVVHADRHVRASRRLRAGLRATGVSSSAPRAGCVREFKHQLQ